MSDSESEESNKPGCSDSESGHPGKSSADSQQQLGINMCPHSAGHGKNIAVPIGGEVKLNPSTRSAHQQGNWGGGHVSPEEAEPYNGRKFIETRPNSHVTTPTKKYPAYSFVSSWLGHR